MPYATIAAAKEAGFPTSADDVPLTLAQINKLAKIYDAIKAAGSADNPMAVAWTQWKKSYEKDGGKWTHLKSMVFQSSALQDRYIDDDDIIVNAIKVGTIAKNGQGDTLEFTEDMLKEFSSSWINGFIGINHDRIDTGIISDAWFEHPFTKMRLSGLNPETKSRILSDEYMGVSQDSYGSYDSSGAPGFDGGAGLSIIFYPKIPACSKDDGCTHLASSTIQDSGINNMTEKTYSDTEIKDMVAKAVDYERLESSVKQSAESVAILEKQVGDLSSTISEKDQTMSGMFTSAQVDEAKTSASTEAVDAATAGMFTSEQMDEAKSAAIKDAMEQAKLMATDLANFVSSLPEGIDDTLHTELVSMVEAGDSVGAYRKLHGEVEWKSFKAAVPTGVKTALQSEDPDAEVGGVGVYNPVTQTYSSEVA